MAKKHSNPPPRPRVGTLVDFPAPPPPGSRVPSKPPPALREPANTDDLEVMPLVTKKTKSKEMSAVKAPKKARDPLEVVREAIGELDFLGDPQSAAGICSAALVLGLGARAVVIHAHDARKNVIRVVAASGAKTDTLVGSTTGVDDDVIASTVITNASPMTLVINPDVGLTRHAPERLKTIGAERAVVAMPALVKKRVIAIVEVVDAKESAATAVEPAAQYAAIQLGRFLVTRKAR